MFKQNSNYEMPTALKQKLRLAKRKFSSNKSSFEAAAPPPISYSKNAKDDHVKLSKRETKKNASMMNQQLAEIEAALARLTKQRQLYKDDEYNPSKYLESELRTAYRISYIDLVLSESTTMV